MGFKQFFRKVEKGTKDFFKKGGIAETGLRKAGNSLSQIAPVVNKIGDVASSIAPELKMIPGIGGALSSGARAIGKATPQISSALNKLSSGAKNLSKGSVMGIQAPKPAPEAQPWNAFDELPFA
jgi:methyl-accepting chemotaxis protein